MLHCSKWVYLRCSLLFFYIQNCRQILLMELPPAASLFLLEIPHLLCVEVKTDLGLLQLVYFCCATWPIWPPPPPCQCSSSAPLSSSNLLSPYCPLCIFSLITASCSWLFFHTSCLLFLPDSLKVFNRMLEVSTLYF